jgi:hypothetical protein
VQRATEVRGAEVLRCRGGAVEVHRWCRDAEAFTEVQMCRRGADVQRCRDAEMQVVLWCRGVGAEEVQRRCRGG